MVLKRGQIIVLVAIVVLAVVVAYPVLFPNSYKNVLFEPGSGSGSPPACPPCKEYNPKTKDCDINQPDGTACITSRVPKDGYCQSGVCISPRCKDPNANLAGCPKGGDNCCLQGETCDKPWQPMASYICCKEGYKAVFSWGHTYCELKCGKGKEVCLDQCCDKKTETCDSATPGGKCVLKGYKCNPKDESPCPEKGYDGPGADIGEGCCNLLKGESCMHITDSSGVPTVTASVCSRNSNNPQCEVNEEPCPGQGISEAYTMCCPKKKCAFNPVTRAPYCLK